MQGATNESAVAHTVQPAAPGEGAPGEGAPGERADHPADAATPTACAAAVLEVVPALMRVIRARMRAQRAAGLSVVQFRALGYVGRHAGAPLSALAEHLGLTPPATSRLVEGMVARGMLRRDLSRRTAVP